MKSGKIWGPPRSRQGKGITKATLTRPSAANTRPDMTARCVRGHVFFNIAAHGGAAQMGFDVLNGSGRPG